MNEVKTEFQFGDVPVVLETGKIARQASGAVMVSMGDTVVLVACVASKEARPDQGFSRSRWITRKKLMQPGRSPVDSSGARGGRRKRRC